MNGVQKSGVKEEREAPCGDPRSLKSRALLPVPSEANGKQNPVPSKSKTKKPQTFTVWCLLLSEGLSWMCTLGCGHRPCHVEGEPAPGSPRSFMDSVRNLRYMWASKGELSGNQSY